MFDKALSSEIIHSCFNNRTDGKPYWFFTHTVKDGKYRIMDVTCAILAGGKSRRMGRDKATLKCGEKALINQVYDTVKHTFQHVIILSNHHNNIYGIDAPILKDVIPIQGSMVGIVSALMFADTPYVFVLACDMPFISEKAFEYMIQQVGGEDIIIPRTGCGYEPLHTIYNRSCISPMLKSIENDRLQITALLPYLSVKELDEHPCFFNRGHPVFTNINEEEDLPILNDSMSNETIREMREEDIEGILNIENLSFISPWTKRFFEETLSSPISKNLIIVKDKVVLGYIILYSVENEAHILNIATHPAYRKKGYASQLITHALAYFKDNNVTDFYLEVREGNMGAINLYTQYGFEKIGKRRKYYTETNEDALVMHLTML